jgi:hypothetical protein
MLKYNRSIREAERHNLLLEMTVARFKGDFPPMYTFDLQQIVCSPKIDLRKDSLQFGLDLIALE